MKLWQQHRPNGFVERADAALGLFLFALACGFIWCVVMAGDLRAWISTKKGTR